MTSNRFDKFGKELTVGDKVLYIKGGNSTAVEAYRATVRRFSPKKVEIEFFIELGDYGELIVDKVSLVPEHVLIRYDWD